ncbi:hypothetical protein PMI13_02936 [Chryseobacterium populi]|uniref:Uncharacterized protein n=1 Tax=Chryseobacterium populi TaxID=1144316 RepID=J3CF14_9FLAO|nr:hypothetical protein PMI13_02936 [Chryseobacterium populi]
MINEIVIIFNIIDWIFIYDDFFYLLIVVLTDSIWIKF